MLAREQPEHHRSGSSGDASPRFQLSTELVSGWRSEPPFESSWTHRRDKREAARN
jgi:hypothetical protein